MAFILRNIIAPVASKRIVQCLQARSSFPPLKFSTSTPVEEGSKSQNNFKVELSPSCVKRLEQICQDGSFLRITVEGGGCSGFQYKFDLDNKMTEEDLSFGNDKAKVVVDTISLEYCNGATIDYHSELIRSGFRIVANPLAEKGCSCGTSFSIKLD